MNWGQNAGCDFVYDECDEFIAKYPEQEWYCTLEGYPFCTKNRRSYGVCARDMLMNGCSYVMQYSNYDCQDINHEIQGN